MNVEIAIDIKEDAYVDSLALALIHQGYNVYYNKEIGKLCFTADKDETITEIYYEKIYGGIRLIDT